MRHLRLGLALLPLFPLLALPARAGSVTADSINDHSAALQAAMEQMPRGATLQRSQCQSISTGMGLPRWRCTVWYTNAVPPTAPAPSQPPAGTLAPGSATDPAAPQTGSQPPASTPAAPTATPAP